MCDFTNKYYNMKKGDLLTQATSADKKKLLNDANTGILLRLYRSNMGKQQEQKSDLCKRKLQDYMNLSANNNLSVATISKNINRSNILENLSACLRHRFNIESSCTAECPHRKSLKLTYLELSVLVSSINYLQKNVKMMIDDPQLQRPIYATSRDLSTFSANATDKDTKSTLLRSCYLKMDVIKSMNIIGFRTLKILLSKLLYTYAWITRKSVSVIRQTFLNTSKNFMFMHYLCQTCNETQHLVHIITSQVDQIKSHANHATVEVDDKIRLLSEEVLQIRLQSELQIRNLDQKLQSAINNSNKLAEDNDALRDELGVLKNLVDKMKNGVTVKPPCGPAPPPPPPPPMPSFELGIKPLEKSKLKSAKKINEAENFKRLTITMEDLQKVTLRKTPVEKRTLKRTNVNEFVVSQDMLRSVKLRPTNNLLISEEIRSPSR